MTKTYLPRDYDIFIGIDVDKSKFSFTVRDHTTMNRSKCIPSNPEHLYNYIRKEFSDKKVVCAYEAGPTGFHLYDYLQDRDTPCFVVSPLSIPKPPNECVKTNRLDSHKIAHYLKSGDLTSIRVPERAYRELRHLVKTREIYVSKRKKAKQRIKGVLLSAHLYPLVKDSYSSWSYRYIKEIKEIECSTGVRKRLDMLLMDLEYARTQLLDIHKELKQFCKNHTAIERYMHYLQSIDGIGFITSITILGKSGDPRRLKDIRELGAFVGLVPREHSTGDTVKKGPITHFGDTVLRQLLIEASWSAIRHNKHLNQFFHRIKKKHHPTIGSRKAIVAVARKMTA